MSLEYLLNVHNYNNTESTTPANRNYRIGWIDYHYDHVTLAKNSTSKILIIGDSIAAGLTRYPEVWYRYLSKKSALNFGFSGDRTEHVLWRLLNIELPPSLEYAMAQVQIAFPTVVSLILQTELYVLVISF